MIVEDTVNLALTGLDQHLPTAVQGEGGQMAREQQRAIQTSSMIGDMRIRHLALNVSDAQRSERFYMDEIGLAGTATVEEWGVRLRLGDGFMMALIEGDPLPSDVADRIHFGCDLPDPESVSQLRARLRAAGVREVEWVEEPGYSSVKVRDPDGYLLELSWDIQ